MSPSTAAVLTFFMLLLFGSRGGPSTYDPDPILSISVYHNEKTLRRRHANGNEPRLISRVERIGNGSSERVSEHRGSLFERDAVNT
jgi:hypothetical protein